jgi:hypothetical protein
MVGFQTKLKHGAQVRHLPHDPRPGERRVRPARRPAPQHLHQLAALLDAKLRLKADAAPALRRPDHRRRGLCRKRRHRPAGRPLAAAERLGGRSICRPATPPWAPWSNTSPAATSHPDEDRGRAKKRLMSERALNDLEGWLTGSVLAAAE